MSLATLHQGDSTCRDFHCVGFTALHFAVASSHEHVVAALLNGLASPALRDEYGRTPLDFALQLLEAHPEMYAD